MFSASQIVHMIKTSDTKPITAAVGDGANAFHRLNAKCNLEQLTMLNLSLCKQPHARQVRSEL